MKLKKYLILPSLILLIAVLLIGCSANASLTSISSNQLADMLENKDFILIDTHIPEQQHIPGTDLFIPFNNLDAIVAAIPDKDQKVVLYCRSGNMSKQVAQQLLEKGYTNLYDLKFGLNEWISEERDVLPVGSI